MKYKANITNLSFEIELEEIHDSPIIEKPPISEKPPVIVEPPVSDVLDLDEVLDGEAGSVYYLPKEWKGKWIPVTSKGMIKPKIKGIVGDGVFLQFQDWNETPTQLIDLSECEEFFIRGVQFVCPPNRPIVTGFPDKELFGWKRDSIKRGKFAWIDAPEVTDKDLVTFGLCRFAYSADSDERIFLVGKNLFHNGFNFMQLKNPYRGNVYAALVNIDIHNPIIRQPQSHYYSPTDISCRVHVKDGMATMISENTYDQILTSLGYNNGNQRSILYFGQFVYDISAPRVVDPKTLILDKSELQVGDITNLGKVVRKEIDFSRKKNWIYSFEPTRESEFKQSPDGIHDAYIVYKGNAGFSNGRLSSSTNFGDGEVLISQGYGWSWYCEEFSGYIEDFNGSGFFWNTNGSDITDGLTIRSSNFEKGKPDSNSDKDMDVECAAWIAEVESY